MAGIRKSNILKSAVLAASLGAAYLYYENNRLEVKKYTCRTERGKGVRLLQLSDLHDKVMGKDNERLLKKIDEIKPDMILLTGDTVSSGAENLGRTCDFLRKLSEKYPVAGILGNHEQRKGCKRKIISEMREAGVELLINEQKEFKINGCKINILGLCEKQALVRTDYIREFLNILKYENHDKELERLENSDGIRILLSHFPENYALTGETAYNRFSFELMLSGHAHGGQIRLPYLGGIYAPGQGLFPKYCKGLYKGRNNSLIISGGIGNDGPVPRINNPPSLAIIDFI